MGVVMPVIWLLMKLGVITIALVIRGSAGSVFHLPLVLAPFESPMRPHRTIETPTLWPSYNLAHLPPTVQAIAPSMPPSVPERRAPNFKAPVSTPVAPVSMRSNAQSPASQPNESVLYPPLVLPPSKSAPGPPRVKGTSTSSPSPSCSLAPLPSTVRGIGPSMPPSVPQRKPTDNKAPVSFPVAPAPPTSMPQNAPAISPVIPGTLPPSAHQVKVPDNKAPVPVPIASTVPAAMSPGKSQQNQTVRNPIMPGVPPLNFFAPVTSPPSKLPEHLPVIHPIKPAEPPYFFPEPVVSPASTAPPSISWKRNGLPTAAPPTPRTYLSPSVSHSPTKSPSPQEAMRHSDAVPAPHSSFESPPDNGFHSPLVSPSSTFYRHNHGRGKNISPARPSSSLGFPPSKQHGAVISPAPERPPKLLPNRKQRNIGPPPLNPVSHVSPLGAPPPLPSSPSGHTKTVSHISPAPAISPPTTPSVHTRISPSHSALPPPVSHVSPVPAISPSTTPSGHTRSSSVSPFQPPFTPPMDLNYPTHAHAPSPSQTAPAGHTKVPFPFPGISPSRSSPRNPKTSLMPPIQALPPPPPNEDCGSIVCTEPLTNTPPGSPCGCVWPMQVGLRLSVALYTFFPLVSELAQEIASGVFMKQSQVRIMGANAANQQPEKTVVLINLVPLGETFDNTTAFLTFQRFWHKQIVIKASFFGDYEVLYVHYPGLPPSPPMASSGINMIDDGPYSGHDNNGRRIQPLGADVRGQQHKHRLSGSVIAIIVLSASVAAVLCSATAWVLFFKRDHVCQSDLTPQALLPSVTRPSGNAGSMVGSGLSSASLSFGSSMATYTGSAKTFSSCDIEKATNSFNASRILGEGGFGRVYSGILEDGTKVAVKVLKRDDQQGGREFLAEVEMLSRLHHRNLVKLIGICIEDRARCLVYELIPNGSVESHLHGVDKETAPLDWNARIKIALGAARGLAYLHEDSSPRVIHRDFKSSNILLEHDFTPKVSDFGLARTAMDEENKHISTRVMGTFGYVAPEYAMTGHLLVKSDVYSYGVVLLELLTGRKPVDMTQPPGQENLVSWARPLLTSKEGLATVIDYSLGPDFPFDSVAKVAAIASMCVQPEVSHRPFMGEVVQALKLVCNECDGSKEVGSRSCSQEDLSIDMDTMVSTGSVLLPEPLQSHFSAPNYDSGLDPEAGLSVPDLFSLSARFGRQASGSFRRHSSSGPLRTGRGRRFWQTMRRLSRGSVSEHVLMFRSWPGSH